MVIRGPNATVRKDSSGLIQVNSKSLWRDQRDTFVLPQHCEQVVFVQDPTCIDDVKDEEDMTKPRWMFVVQIAPRSKEIYEGMDVSSESSSEVQAPREEDADSDIEVGDQTQVITDTVVEVARDDEDDEDIDQEFYNDDIGLELNIDVFGATDLLEDERLERDF